MDERKHCGCLLDESSASCSFELARLEAAKGPAAVERAAVIAFLLKTELDCTPEYVKQRTGVPRSKAEFVSNAMTSILKAVRKGIERGDHVK